MAKQPAATTKPQEQAPAKNKRPTPEQLQQLTCGGRYQFNADNGNFGASRSVTKPAGTAAQKGAK